MRKVICLVVTLILFASCSSNRESNEDSQYLDLSIKVANWLKAQEIIKPQGKIWRSDDEIESTPIMNSGLYNGSSGVILFYLELYHQTQNYSYLQEAKLGADYLLSAIPQGLDENKPSGLYIGVSGLGFTLGEVYKVTKDEKYLNGVTSIVKLLNAAKLKEEQAFNWGSNTDLISGNTGIGLFLLYAYREFQIEIALELAEGTGKSLIRVGRDTIGGKKWMMDPGFPRYMPNFSHGTAGTAYFLASLFEQTGDQAFETAALEGAEHLLAITEDSGLIYHHDPDTTGLVYYGFCHGPTGTGRLYHKLSAISQDDKWLEVLKTANETMIKSNLIETHPEGFWQNVGQCCGSAGVADYFLSLYQETLNPQYLELSLEMTEDIILNMTELERGVKWIHAENRSQPDLLQAQTGYMQGASGIGMYLLRLHAFKNKKSVIIKFPDSPF